MLQQKYLKKEWGYKMNWIAIEHFKELLFTAVEDLAIKSGLRIGGFSRVDFDFGVDLSNTDKDEWGLFHICAALNLTYKYRKQLVGYQIPTVSQVLRAYSEFNRINLYKVFADYCKFTKKQIKVFSIFESQITIFFPYSEDLINELKEIAGYKSFDKELRTWQIQINKINKSDIKAFIKKNEIRRLVTC